MMNELLKNCKKRKELMKRIKDTSLVISHEYIEEKDALKRIYLRIIDNEMGGISVVWDNDIIENIEEFYKKSLEEVDDYFETYYSEEYFKEILYDISYGR